MAQKRSQPSDDGHGDGLKGGSPERFRPRKQLRFEQMRKARQIDVQPSSSQPSSSSSPSMSASNVKAAKPSTASGVSSGGPQPSAPLPSQLDIESHVSAHKFEIKSLLRAIASAASSGSTRAWQMLPRHARRRAASHNLLALPRRLRAKGAAELRSSTTQAVTRSQDRKRKGQSGKVGGYPRSKQEGRREDLARRAGDKERRWLETHLWHAKRFRMSGLEDKVQKRTLPLDGGELKKGGAPKDRWGWNLAETPMMKAHRASVRGALNGCTLHDASYYPIFRVSAKGGEGSGSNSKASDGQDMLTRTLESVLRSAGLADGWGKLEWTGGAVECNTILLAYPPAPSSPGSPDAQAQAKTLPSSSRCRALAPLSVLWIPSQRQSGRELLLRIHPAGCPDLLHHLSHAVRVINNKPLDTRIKASYEELAPTPPEVVSGSQAQPRRHTGIVKREAAAKASKKGKGKDSTPTVPSPDEEERERRRSAAYNVFELIGPDAGRVLGGVLRPVASNSAIKRKVFDDVTKHLRPADVAHGTVLSLEVHDPRLSFPPQNSAFKKIGGKQGKEEIHGRIQTGRTSRDAPLAQGRLLSEGCGYPRVPKGTIDSRRSQARAPGARLAPTDEDDIVPVLLVQRTLRSRHQAATDEEMTPSLSGWALHVPSGWGQAFWLSLVHPTPRVLGQEEVHHQALESGRPSFPHDWVGCKAHAEWEEGLQEERREEWERRPPAKRVNFEKEGTRWPFGGRGMWEALIMEAKKRAIDRGILDTSAGAHEAPTAPWALVASTDEARMSLSAAARGWASPSSSATALLEPLVSLLSAPNTQVIEARIRAGWSDASCQQLAWSLCNAFVHVSLRAVGRGSFEENSELHLGALEGLEAEEGEMEEPQLSANSFVGAVTTGRYALSQGRGFAIGSVSLLGWLEIEGRAKRAAEVQTQDETNASTTTEPLLLVRSRAGKTWRLASACRLEVGPA